MGVVLGFITTALLFPIILEENQIGLLGIISSYANILAHFASLGMRNVIIKVFPVFRSEDKKHHGLISLVSITVLIGYLLSVIIFFLIKEQFLESGSNSSMLLIDYLPLIFPLILFTLFFNIFDSFNSAIQESVIGVFAKEVLQRLIILAGILLLFFHLIDYETFVYLFVGAHLVTVLVSIVYFLSKGHLKFVIDRQFLKPELIRHIFSVAVFGLIAGSSGIVISNVDRIFIERYLGLGATGIYMIVFYFATLVILPSRAMLRITAPVVSEAMSKNDTDTISDVYFKSSYYLWIAGLFIFGALILNLENIFSFLPPEYSQGKSVLIIIGCMNLIDMATGAGRNIVANSRYYRYSTFFQVILIVLVIVFSITLIPRIGLAGAAIAAFLSKLIISILRFFLIKARFGLNPYNLRYLYVLIISGAAYVLSALIPAFSNIYLDFTVRSGLFTIVFFLVVYFSKLAPDMNKWINKVILKSQ